MDRYCFVFCFDICLFSYSVYEGFACLCTTCMPAGHRGQKKACVAPRTGIRDGCEPPCKCWGMNPGPPQEQTVFLTA